MLSTIIITASYIYWMHDIFLGHWVLSIQFSPYHREEKASLPSFIEEAWRCNGPSIIRPVNHQHLNPSLFDFIVLNAVYHLFQCLQKRALVCQFPGLLPALWLQFCIYWIFFFFLHLLAAAAKSLQSCLTMCNRIDGSPPGSPVPGILQARTLEWVAISFSNAWKWEVKVKSLSRVRLLATPWTAAHQAPLSVWFSRQEY